MPHQLPDHDLLRRWLNGEIDSDAIEGHEDLKRVVDTSSQFQLPPTTGKDAAWKKFSAKINAGTADSSIPTSITPATNRPLYLRYGAWAVSAAAVMLTLVGLFYHFQNTVETQNALRAEQTVVTLPGGSIVTLNSDSEIRYQPGKWSSQRIVELEGEAFFEVTKGKPFSVKTPKGIVSVLGTSFNVYSREENLDVSCHTGKVSVTHPNAQKFVLNPGMAVAFSGESILDPFSFDPETTAGWQKGKFSFDNEPLNRVIAVLERQFDVTVEGSYPKGISYSGGFSNNNLDTALNLVFGPFEQRISFSRVGNRILLSEPAR